MTMTQPSRDAAPKTPAFAKAELPALEEWSPWNLDTPTIEGVFADSCDENFRCALPVDPSFFLTRKKKCQK